MSTPPSDGRDADRNLFVPALRRDVRCPDCGEPIVCYECDVDPAYRRGLERAIELAERERMGSYTAGHTAYNLAIDDVVLALRAEIATAANPLPNSEP